MTITDKAKLFISKIISENTSYITDLYYDVDAVKLDLNGLEDPDSWEYISDYESDDDNKLDHEIPSNDSYIFSDGSERDVPEEDIHAAYVLKFEPSEEWSWLVVLLKDGTYALGNFMGD